MFPASGAAIAAAAEDGAAPSRVRGAAGPRAVPAVPAAVFPARGGAHERVGVLSPVRRGRGSAIRTVPGDARGGGGGRRRSPVQRVMRRPRRRQLCRMCRRRRRRPFGFRIWTPVASLAADGVTRFRCNQMRSSSKWTLHGTDWGGRPRSALAPAGPSRRSLPLEGGEVRLLLGAGLPVPVLRRWGGCESRERGRPVGIFSRSSSWCAGGRVREVSAPSTRRPRRGRGLGRWRSRCRRKP